MVSRGTELDFRLDTGSLFVLFCGSLGFVVETYGEFRHVSTGSFDGLRREMPFCHWTDVWVCWILSVNLSRDREALGTYFASQVETTPPDAF